jgi:hypothetical protein
VIFSPTKSLPVIDAVLKLHSVFTDTFPRADTENFKASQFALEKKD